VIKGKNMQDILPFLQRHGSLAFVLVIVLILLVILEFIKQKQGARRLSPLQTTQLINHENAVIVDIRSVDAFAKGHITSAVSLPLADLEQQIKKLDKFKSSPIVIVCATGLESARAANLLIQKGFNTFILAGGIRSWQDANIPLVKDK
jgi:rhodanese-related sulfurtransferase